jgi:hypothetical protein
MQASTRVGRPFPIPNKPAFATEKNWKSVRITSLTLPIINNLAAGYEKTEKKFSSKCACALQMSACAGLALPEAAARLLLGVITVPSMFIAPKSTFSSFSFVAIATGFENIAVTATALVAAGMRLSTDKQIDVAEIANKVSFGWLDLSR